MFAGVGKSFIIIDIIGIENGTGARVGADAAEGFHSGAAEDLAFYLSITQISTSNVILSRTN